MMFNKFDVRNTLLLMALTMMLRNLSLTPRCQVYVNIDKTKLEIVLKPKIILKAKNFGNLYT